MTTNTFKEMQWIRQDMAQHPAEWFSSNTRNFQAEDKTIDGIKLANPRLFNEITQAGSKVPDRLAQNTPLFEAKMDKLCEELMGELVKSAEIIRQANPSLNYDDSLELLKNKQKKIADDVLTAIDPLFNELLLFAYMTFTDPSEYPVFAKKISESGVTLPKDTQIESEDFKISLTCSLLSSYLGMKADRYLILQLSKLADEKPSDSHPVERPIFAGIAATIFSPEVLIPRINKYKQYSEFCQNLFVIAKYDPSFLEDILERYQALQGENQHLKITDKRFPILQYQAAKLAEGIEQIDKNPEHKKQHENGMKNIHFVMCHLFDTNEISRFEEIQHETRSMTWVLLLVYFEKLIKTLTEKIQQLLSPLSFGYKRKPETSAGTTEGQNPPSPKRMRSTVTSM